MKTLNSLLISLAIVAGFTSCEDPFGPQFTVDGSPDSVVLAFNNTFLDTYFLDTDVEDNIAERFFWEKPDFGATINLSYDIQGSIDPTFSTFETVGTTNETNYGVTIGDLIGFARDQGLDDDPATTTETGAPNNVGEVYFRLRVYTGIGEDLEIDTVSESYQIAINWVERQPTGGGCQSLFLVGNGTNADWNWGTAVELTCENNVYTGRVRLINGDGLSFRMFTERDEWGSGLNYPHYEGEGYTIASEFENAGDGESNFKFTGTTGVYEMTIDDNNQTISIEASGPVYLVGNATQAGWDWATPVVMEQILPYVYQGSVTLTSSPGGENAFRVFTVDGDWGSGLNFPYYEDEGYTIDDRFYNADDGDSNFAFSGTDGTYTMTINDLDQTITLE